MRRMKAAEREVLVLDGQFALLESEKIAIESKLPLSLTPLSKVKSQQTRFSKLLALPKKHSRLLEIR